jgi:hypothetical protein
MLDNDDSASKCTTLLFCGDSEFQGTVASMTSFGQVAQVQDEAANNCDFLSNYLNTAAC